MLLPLVILFIATAYLIIWWYIQFFKYNRHLAKYPGPFPFPVIGNAHRFRTTQDLIPVLREFQSQFGGLVKVMIGHQPRIIITDPKFAEFLLGSTELLEKSHDYKYLRPWLGTGLLTSSNTKWKRQRKLITPTFHFQILEQFISTFNYQTDILIKKLSKKVGEEAFDIFPYISLCALDIICEAAMGTSVNAQSNSNSEYVYSVKEMCRIAIGRTISPVKMWDFLYRFSDDYQKEKKALGVLHGYTNFVINKKKDQLANNTESKITEEDGTGIKKRSAFLDLLLQCRIDGEPLCTDNIREEVDTFMFEGHDTTASGISFTLYCLSQNPHVQDKVVEELRVLFADDKKRVATYQDLQDMKYLDMVIKETLRLFPSVPLYARHLEENVEYEGGVLPKGLCLTIFVFGLHRRPEIYPNPETFDPERFLPKNSIGRSPYAYLPFSAGPRNCVGQKFAVLEMKSTVSKILRNFELLPVCEHKPILVPEAIIKSANGLPIYLRERKF